MIHLLAGFVLGAVCATLLLALSETPPSTVLPTTMAGWLVIGGLATALFLLAKDRR
jgi:hypothetical protein